jgi:hypothetical protein
MFLKLVTLCALIVSSFAKIRDCDTSSIFRPTQLSISPDPPISGSPVKLTLIFDNTGDEITSGAVTTTVSLNGMPLSPTTVALCKNTLCPIVSGSNDRSTEMTFPSVSGNIKSKVVWTGPKGESLLCIDTSLKIANTFSIIHSMYKENKEDIKSLYNKLEKLTAENNLRGIIHEITSDEK